MSDRPHARLRRLEERDIETVAGFEREIAKISFPDDPVTDLEFYSNKVKRLLHNNDAACFVAEDDTGVVGWAYVSARSNFITKERYADFHSIYVSPSQRGGGVVSMLIEAVFEHCRRHKFGHVVFRTRATNEPMKKVLTRVGFVPTQIYYEKHFDAES
jgi:ribosomal protein S18 acetylase RimI-like enzyme